MTEQTRDIKIGLNSEYGTFVSRYDNNVGFGYKLLLKFYLIFCIGNVGLLVVYWLNIGYIHQFIVFLLLPLVLYKYSFMMYYINIDSVKRVLFNIIFFNLSWLISCILIYILIIHDDFHHLFKVDNVLEINQKYTILSIFHFFGYTIQICLTLYLFNLLNKITIFADTKEQTSNEKLIENQQKHIKYLENKIKLMDSMNKISWEEDRKEENQYCMNCDNLEQKYQEIFNEKDVLTSKFKSKKEILKTKKKELTCLRDTIKGLQKINLDREKEIIYLSSKISKLTKDIKRLNILLNIERKNVAKAQEYIHHCSTKK